MSQIRTKMVTLNSVMRRREFRLGIAHYHRGLPADAHDAETIDAQWSYERGRQFAAVYPHVKPLDLKPVRGAVPEKYQSMYRREPEIR